MIDVDSRVFFLCHRLVHVVGLPLHFHAQVARLNRLGSDSEHGFAFGLEPRDGFELDRAAVNRGRAVGPQRF